MKRAMLLAAGRGERMRPLTDRLPKPLLMAGDRTLVEHQLTRLVEAGMESVVINLAWQGDRIRAALGDGASTGMRIVYSEEGGTPIGTAAGIRKALPLLGEDPFLVVNGDVWSDHPLRSMALPPGRLAHLVLVPNPAHHPMGDFSLDDNGTVAAGGGDSALTYSGIGVYAPVLFAGSSDRDLGPLLRSACDRGEVSGELWNGEWEDIGTPERLEALRTRLA